MPLHIIVDGYNFIRRSRQLNELDRQDILLGREALQDLLFAYKKVKRHRITVVFDGRNILSGAGKDQQPKTKGIQIIFSQKGRTADDVIKRMAEQEREQALIVSSDNDLIDFCASQGATVIRSEAFEDTIYQALYSPGNASNMETDVKRGKPSTKKKGPSRRLSKKERQYRRRTGKL
jgi:predicted RNA-binding protein with PIN domain